MMFSKIRLDGQSTIDLPIFGMRPNTLYVLKEAFGLGPPDIDVSIADEQYLSRTPIAREIVLRIGLNANWSAGISGGELRSRLYGLLTPRPNDSIGVQIMNGDDVLALAWGYVKKIEVSLFSKDPEVQVTIACKSPYLQAPDRVVRVPTDHTDFIINNKGSVTTGFYLEMKYTDNRTYFELSVPGTARFRINYDFDVNDVLMINTQKGSRRITVDRGPNNVNLLRYLSDDSVWFQLFPGDNTFTVEPIGVTDFREFSYLPQYWGV